MKTSLTSLRMLLAAVLVAIGVMMLVGQLSLATPTPTPTPTPVLKVSPTATPKTASTATPVPRTTSSPTAKPSATAVASPKPSTTTSPSGTPVPRPTATATPKTTSTGTPVPRTTPAPTSTARPTASPAATATAKTQIITGTIQGHDIEVGTPGPSPSAPSGSGDVTKGTVVLDHKLAGGDQNLKVVTRNTTYKEGQLIDGQLLCPKLGKNPEGNWTLQKGCQASGFGISIVKQSYSKATFLGKSDGMDCTGYKRVGGLGGAFYDLFDGGTCWACPVQLHRGIGTHITDDNACTAGNDDAIVWQSAQYPEPGVVAFTNPEIVGIAFNNPKFVDAFLTKRAGFKGSKQKMWEQMINSPNDSPEFKALIYAAMIFVARQDPSMATQASDSVLIFEQYIKQRRAYIARDALAMYDKYLDLNAYKQNQGTKQQLLGGGPLGYASKATGAIITSPTSALSNVVGIPPNDYVGAAYAAAEPDSRGEEFMKALLDLSGTEYDKGKIEEAEVDVVAWATLGVLATDSAARIHDSLEANGVIKGIGFLEGQGGANFGLGLSLIGGALDLIAASMTIYAQEEAQKQYEELVVEANKDVSVREILEKGTDEEKNNLIMWWALATSPYKASDTFGKGAINSWDVCQNPTYQTRCADIKQIVAKAAPKAAPTPPPASPEIMVQVDATKSLAQLLSGVTSAASATAAKPRITVEVGKVNQAAANVKKLTGPAWGAANVHRGELDAANTLVKKELTRIQGVPDAYSVIKDVLAPLNMSLPGGRAPSD